MCIFDVSTQTCDLPKIEMLWNSVLSTPGAKFFTLDLTNFYLGSTMACSQYMRLPIKTTPKEIIDKYNLNDIVEDGWVYVKIVKGMYSLPESGKYPTTRSKTLGKVGLLTNSIHARSLETCAETHHLHISSR